MIDGKQLAQNLKIDLCNDFKNKNIGLAIIYVGNNKASKNYIDYKLKDCMDVGVFGECINFSEDISYKELEREIKRICTQDKYHGVILQLPLPNHLAKYEQDLLNLIPVSKDVDGLNQKNLVLRNTKNYNNKIYPATPYGIYKYLTLNQVRIKGSNIAIVGRSNLVGKPLFDLLIEKNASVMLLHSHSNLNMLKNFDIVIVAVGSANLIEKKHLKQNCIVIDVGTNFVNNKLVGDVASNAKDLAWYVSPVPGGVGPMTRISIFLNLKKLIEKK